MFELSVACKYLLPRRRQLSVSIISLISVLVIALVVWLIVVFFSVTDGLEKNWIQKLTALTAPVRITPTDAYYNSYYYQIDSISAASGYNHKTIREKLEASGTDPYESELDEEVPAYWPAPDVDASGNLKDLVGSVYQAVKEVNGVPGVEASDFELTGGHIRLKLAREVLPQPLSTLPVTYKSYLSYPAYLGNFESENTRLTRTLLPVTAEDSNNILNLLFLDENPVDDEEAGTGRSPVSHFSTRERVKRFFSNARIDRLKTKSSGWIMPRAVIPVDAHWNVSAVFRNETLVKILVPLYEGDTVRLQGMFADIPEVHMVPGRLSFSENGTPNLHTQESTLTVAPHIPIVLAPETTVTARLDDASVDSATKPEGLRFIIETPVQGVLLRGTVPYKGFEIGSAELLRNPSDDASPLWVHARKAGSQKAGNTLPLDPEGWEGLLLPKTFRDAGALIGDRGYITYMTPTASILQEQRLPVYVAGFYDPGIIPVGGKFILANRDLTSIVHDAHGRADKNTITNGINVRFDDFQSAESVKEQLIRSLKNKGMGRYWQVETFREYEFTKEIMRELQSQKSLFSLIAVVIIVVACSNIISMLIILVNDKKLEIGILRSMGASSRSIALIFGLAGALIGIIGSTIGILGALVTLRYLEPIMGMMSRMRGQDLLYSAFYGDSLPHELSYEALSFVIVATAIVSLLAGIIPAIKACLLKPSAILRSGG